MTLSRRDRKKLRTRRELAEAAVELFREKGYADTTIEEIADAADYSSSTLHRHFDGKEDVVFYEFPERLAELRAAFADPAHGTAWETIRDALMANARHWDEDEGEFGRERARLFHEVPALRRRYVEYGLEWEDAMAEVIARESGGDSEDIATRLPAAAAVTAFRVAWRAQVAAGDVSLADQLELAFDALEAGFGSG